MPHPRTQQVLDRAIQQAPATIAKQSRGQPAKRTRKHFVAWTVSQLLETYQDPRAILLEIASTDTHKLAEKAGITPGEALAERRLCAQAVLPYVAQKLPVQVDMRHTRAIHLNLVTDDQYKDLVTIAEATDDAPADNHVQLLTSLADEHDTSDDGTAAGDAPQSAHVHAEQSGDASARTPQASETGVAPSAPVQPGQAGKSDAGK